MLTPVDHHARDLHLGTFPAGTPALQCIDAEDFIEHEAREADAPGIHVSLSSRNGEGVQEPCRGMDEKSLGVVQDRHVRGSRVRKAHGNEGVGHSESTKRRHQLWRLAVKE